MVFRIGHRVYLLFVCSVELLVLSGSFYYSEQYENHEQRLQNPGVFFPGRVIFQDPGLGDPLRLPRIQDLGRTGHCGS